MCQILHMHAVLIDLFYFSFYEVEIIYRLVKSIVKSTRSEDMNVFY